MNNALFLQIAGFNIKIDFQPTEWVFAEKKLKQDIKDYYSGFILSKKPIKINYTIIIRESIAFSTINEKNTMYVGLYVVNSSTKITTFYQISIIQFQIIIREALSNLLSCNNGFILHGSSSGKDNKAYIFIGKNGAGKSTSVSLATPEYKALADDTVIIKKEKNGFYFYQTPFIEKNDWIIKDNKKYEINNINLLIKSKEYKKELITNKNMLIKRLIKQFWTNQSDHKNQIKLIIEFTQKFNNFYYLYFGLEKNKFQNLLK